jgi:tetratricopeptide (TPR) repeat protein
MRGERRETSSAPACHRQFSPGRGLPAGHIAFASLAFEHALNAQAAGDRRSALAYSSQSVAIAEAAIKARGQGSDYLPIFLVRRSDIELQSGRGNDAAEDATRAVNILQKAAQPGTFSSTLGRAYLSLGRALQVQGKPDEARSALRPAVEHLQSALGPDHSETLSARTLADPNAPR